MCAVLLNQEFNTESFRAASVIPMFAAVQVDASSVFGIIPANNAASVGVIPVFGLAKATYASVGVSADIQTGGWGKALAAASLGIGAFVGVGIGTSSLVPIGASGVASALGAAGVQYARFAVGQALENAAAGQIFTVKIAPRQVI